MAGQPFFKKATSYAGLTPKATTYFSGIDLERRGLGTRKYSHIGPTCQK